MSDHHCSGHTVIAAYANLLVGLECGKESSADAGIFWCAAPPDPEQPRHGWRIEVCATPILEEPNGDIKTSTSFTSQI